MPFHLCSKSPDSLNIPVFSVRTFYHLQHFFLKSADLKVRKKWNTQLVLISSENRRNFSVRNLPNQVIDIIYLTYRGTSEYSWQLVKSSSQLILHINSSEEQIFPLFKKIILLEARPANLSEK